MRIAPNALCKHVDDHMSDDWESEGHDRNVAGVLRNMKNNKRPMNKNTDKFKWPLF